MSSSKSTGKATEAVEAGKVEEKVKTAGKPAQKKAVNAQEESTPTATKPAKKTTRKTATKKTDKPEVIPEVYIEYQGQQALETAVIEKVKAAYIASGHRAASIKSLQIYIKPEEFKAYYVINSGKKEFTGEVFLF